jgi:hypothetical protein
VASIGDRSRPPPVTRARIATPNADVKPRLHADYSVSAYCPSCEVVTHFKAFSQVLVTGAHPFAGSTYARVLYSTLQCSNCNRAALATVPDNGNIATAMLESFFPISGEAATLPAGVPPEIKAEFREAESCAAFGANRAASARFRSVLEKTLKLNGYIKGNERPEPYGSTKAHRRCGSGWCYHGRATSKSAR